MTSRLERLQALRDRLLLSIESDRTSAHALAPLAAQYRDTMEQIAALEAEEANREIDPLDELRARKEAKRAAG